MHYLGKKNKNLFRMTAMAVIIALLSSYIFPKEVYAARSNAGGGKIGKPDWGDVAENIGITIGTAVGGSFLSNSFNSAWNTANPAIAQGSQVATQSTDLFSKFGNFITEMPNTIGKTINATGELINNPLQHFGVGFSSLNSLSEVAPIIVKGYTTYTAGTQVSRAIGMAGQYYGWSPKTTFAISGLGVGASTGFLNPSAALGETFSPGLSTGSAMVKGAFVGGLSGWAGAATIGAIDGDKINAGENPGIAAQLAGTAAGLYATEFGKTLLDPATYSKVWAKHSTNEVREYVPDYEFGEGAWRRVDNANGELGNLEIITPEGLQKLQEEAPAGVKIELAEEGGSLKITVPRVGPDIKYVNAEMASSYTEEQLRESSGLPQYKRNLRAKGYWETDKDLSLNGGIAAMQRPESEHYLAGISTEQLDFAYNVKPGLTSDSLYLPVINQLPTSSQVLGRVFLHPLTETINHWPLFATRWLALEYEKKNDNKWLPLAQEAIYATAMPLLDNAATIWNLKADLDEKLGYFPEIKYQREQLFSRALVDRVFAKLPNNIDALTKNIELTPEERLRLDGIINDQNLNDKERVKQLSLAIVDIARKGGASDLNSYERAGGSEWRLFSTTAKNVFFSELPIALISGSIDVGMNDSLAGKSSTEAMSAALRNITISGAVRGLLWHSYGIDKYRHQMANIANHDDNPVEVFTYMPVAEADIISARIRGYLPRVDDRKFSAEKEYRYNGQSVSSTAELQAKINELGDAYKIPRENLDLSKVDLANVIAVLNKANQTDGIKTDFAEGGGRLKIMTANQQGVYETVAEYVPDYEFGEGAWRRVDSSGNLEVLSQENMQELRVRAAAQESLDYLSKIEQIVKQVKLDDKGPYHLGAGVLTNPIPDSKGLYSLELDMRKSPLQPDSVKVFGVEGGNYLIKSQQEAEDYRTKGFTIHNNEIVPIGEYKIPGKNIWGPYDVVRPTELMPTVVGSLGQSAFEFGWQSLATGLPYTYQGKMNTYAWVNYLDTMKYLASSAAQGGIFNVMNQYATSTGAAQNFGVAKGLVGRNILTTIADTPVGNWLGMASLIPVSGYKGMPFSVAANIETGYKTVETKYYPYWPYQRMNVVPHDPFWRNIKAGMFYKYGQADLSSLNIGKDANGINNQEK